MIPKIFNRDDSTEEKLVLPLLPLRDIVIFPHMVAPLFVGRTKSVNALADAMNRNKTVFLATQRKAKIDEPKPKDIHSVGTIGTVLQLLRLPDGTVKALVEGKQRAAIAGYRTGEEFFQVELDPIQEVDISGAERTALMRAIIAAFEEYTKINKNISKDLVKNVGSIADPSQLCDTIASQFNFKIEDKQRLLETADLAERLSFLLRLIKLEIEIFETDQRVKARVKEQMEKTQRNYYLNEQMRAIKKEMGAEEDPGDDLKELERRIKRKRMPKDAAAKVRQEFKKLKLMTPMSAEATVVRNYSPW